VATSGLLVADISEDVEEALEKPFDELTVAEWERIKSNSALIRSQLEQAYQSDNFGCYNRVGGRVKGNEFIAKERRRLASGGALL